MENFEYLGVFQTNIEHNGDFHRLYDYIKDTESDESVEIVIAYIFDAGFRVKQLAICLENTDMYTTYDVFKCDYRAKTDLEAKEKACFFAENLLKYRRTFSSYMKQYFENHPEELHAHS